MKLGYIGIGLMGKPMVLRLLAAGHEVTVWNRSKDKLQPVLEKGAKAADSPAAVARAAEIVMMCVTDQKAAEEVLFGLNGISGSEIKNKLLVDFSSIAPASARDFAQRLGTKGMGMIDAPVSGGVPGAEKGTLAIMAGGRAADIERARPVVMHLAQRFTRMGDSGAGQVTKLCNQIIVGSLFPVVMHLAQRFTRMGDSGAGQVTKLCNQIIVGSLFPVLAEAIRLAEAAGVDAKMLPEALKGGFADSLPLQVFGARMAARQFEPPLGTNAIMLKDLSNAAMVAKEFGVPLPMAESAAARYRLLVEQGKAEKDPAVLVDLLTGKA